MNVLILTNHSQFNFVYDVTYPHKTSNQIHIFAEEEHPFAFDGWNINYDVGISFMHLYRVPKKQIEHRPWINFHPGPLPEYKGRNLCYHAIMNGEKEFGATVHYMDENFDTGDIIEVRKFPIGDFFTALDLSRATISCSQKLFQDYLPRILAGEDFLRYPNPKGMYYKKTNIAEVVSLDKDVPLSRFIRAVYYPPYYPKFEIGGVAYKIVKDE